MAEAAARYGMTARAFERLLERVGWMKDGRMVESAVSRGYLTEDLKIGPRGLGFLDGYLERL